MIRMGDYFNFFFVLSVFFNLHSREQFQFSAVQAYVDKGIVSDSVKKLLELSELKHDGTLESIVEVTQKNWLRKAGTERWQMEEVSEDKLKDMKEVLAQFNFSNEIVLKKKYDYLVVLGASLPSVKQRFAYLLKLWVDGIRADKIIILSGNRDLDSEYELKAFRSSLSDGMLPLKKDHQIMIKPLPKNEIEMMELIYKNIELPQELSQIEVVFVDAPKIALADGSFSRPTTLSTIDAWLDKGPKPGSCLFISNQPYVAYQEAIIKTNLPETFSYETVGARVEDFQNISVANLLDNIARILYQEQNYLKKKSVILRVS